MKLYFKGTELFFFGTISANICDQINFLSLQVAELGTLGTLGALGALGSPGLLRN